MKQYNNYNQIFVKVVFCGDSFIGKTCLVKNYVDEEFESIYTPTIGVDLVQKITTKVQIWDIGKVGVKFQTVTYSYFKDTKAVVFVYDISNRQSFQCLSQRMEEIIQINQANKKVYDLVGQKYDLKYDRQVSHIEAQQLAESFGMIFIEVSAKTSHNINLFFDRLIEHIITI